MYKNEITLPLHTLLTDEQVQYICQSLKKLKDSGGLLMERF